ncbi:hypothetical protein F0562_021240 [Nyssa sinensis]|uniref:Bifunctional inhibitor/plant lipid transfer protein/seed storage helical domain-containing protein n=1 Tax=Nyssa sinensis TaxID=561372 RepID=A0A5J5BJF7_9ASTE|nr:hypothetical protein F0562_021240 [Nyssa sinensis]
MEGFKAFPCLIATLLVLFPLISVNGQISTPCTSSMISSFTPCINYITGSTSSGSSPTSDCCASLGSLISDSMDCSCLIITGNVPLSLPFPINPSLAISLPQACQQQGSVPLQCKASGVPLPAPGPVSFGPTLSPIASAPLSPRASKASASKPPPAETTKQITSASPPVHSVARTANPGIRPVLTPTSASNPTYLSSPSILLIIVGIMVFKCY